jgi:hypothetical protein
VRAMVALGELDIEAAPEHRGVSGSATPESLAPLAKLDKDARAEWRKLDHTTRAVVGSETGAGVIGKYFTVADSHTTAANPVSIPLLVNRRGPCRADHGGGHGDTGVAAPADAA